MRHFLWMDLETTGLNPETRHIVEAAWAVVPEEQLTDSINARRRMIRAGTPAIFTKPERHWDSVARDLHLRSGLLAEWDRYSFRPHSPYVRTGTPPVEDAILKDLEDLDPDEDILLAGSNCDFERQWIRYHMPVLNDRLHHRALDVSRIRTALDYIAPELAAEAKATSDAMPVDREHRAFWDLRDHIGEWQFYYRVLNDLWENRNAHPATPAEPNTLSEPSGVGSLDEI